MRLNCRVRLRNAFALLVRRDRDRFIRKPLRTNVYATIVQVAYDDIDIHDFHSGGLVVDHLG